MTEKIIKVDYVSEMNRSYIDYSMSVIVGRALPDVRDGLKPVHRRILYAMNELNLSPDKPFKKSARIVGDVLGKYHPHGDSPVYEAMVRQSQSFQTINPLVEGHGNFGSIDGDSPAHMRYTEARLSGITMKMLEDIDKNTIDFSPNFDNSLKEPDVLPSKFPNLLVNGSSGIAVGMKTDIPPHNLAEVIDGVTAYMGNRDITTKELMKHIKAPDFPTGGTIINKDDLLEMYETGKGKVVIRANMDVEDIGYGKKQLIVTDIPYSMSGNKTRLLEDIISKIKDRKLEELTDISDESDSSGIRIVLETRKDVNIENLKEKLYKITKLQDNVPVNFLAIDNKRPVLMNLKTLIEKYVDFQIEINTRKYTYMLEKERNKYEILEGLLEATDKIDLIIAILKGAKTTAIVKDCLMTGNIEHITLKTKVLEKSASQLCFTELQTKAILEMRLQRLIGLETEIIEVDMKEALENIKSYEKILSSEENIFKVIRTYLEEIKKEFKKKRQSKVKEVEIVDFVEIIEEEKLYILVDKFNYIKAVDDSTYSRLNEETINAFKQIIPIKNTSKLAIFTKEGNLHQVNVLDIPKVKIKDRGVPIDSFYNNNKETILLIVAKEDMDSCNILFVTEKSLGKLVECEEFETNRTTLISTKIKDDDKLIHLEVITEKDMNKTIEFKLSNDKMKKMKYKDIPVRKRNTLGITLVKALKDKKIVEVTTSK